MSLVLIGLCHGFNSNTRTMGTNTFTDNQVLVEVETGVNNVWNQLKGKQVSVPVFVGAWASKAGNAGFDLWLSGDGKPMNVQLVKPVQAAS